MNPVIVSVSRNGHMLDSMASQLAVLGVSWVRSNPGESAMAAIGRHAPDLVIVDSGTESDARVLASVNRIKKRYPSPPIFLIARKSSESLAIGALKAGVDDYFKAPLCTDDLLACIDHRLLLWGCRSKSSRTRATIEARMVGNSRVMSELKKQLERVSMVDSTVLITGETGTGKELAAGLVHQNSNRARQPLVSVNCAALPDSLVESELFGYQRGAFTGAASTTRGRFEQAHGGTVFLDEIGDMTPFAQAKILRTIEDKRIFPLGGATPIPLDFRLIAATNQDPEALMAKGAFRDDLFYRLNVARLNMPPLRKHPEDIPSLVNHGIRRLNRKFNRSIQCLSSTALDVLMQYAWPGNVRELMNLLEAAYINMPVGRIRIADLPPQFCRFLEESRLMSDDERTAILSALMATKWNKSSAARKLKWSRMTLYRKMAKYKITTRRGEARV